ncbi:MAG: hypothetical protein K1X88_21355 [Nannocystaceae bacterium]|nr:hypothetical protein [Nannocystaceae bacterium]
MIGARGSIAPAGDDPFEIFSGVGPQLGLLLVLGAVAIAVVWISRRRAASSGRSSGRGRGRPDWADPAWRAMVKHLQELPPVPLAKAGDEVVRVVATLTSAPAHLGGPPERACVWSNLHGQGADSAIAVELVFVADASGHAAVEGLEHARVIAPMESAPGKHAHEPQRRRVALYLGDEVEIVARFVPDPPRAGGVATELVYGTLGSRGPLEIRVLQRPAPPEAPAPPADATAPVAADAPDGDIAS